MSSQAARIKQLRRDHTPRAIAALLDIDIADVAATLAGKNPWVRPDWLELPAVAPGDEKFVGLVPIFDHDANFLALQAAGDYTVDWGDGNVEDVSSGAQANHHYAWADIPAGTLTARGYRQAVVVVAPQEGQQLTDLNFAVHHPDVHPGPTPWLDVAIEGANLGRLVFSTWAGDVFPAVLERAVVGDLPVLTGADPTDNGLMFYFAPRLQQLTLGDLPALTDGSYMFSYCSALQQLTLGDLPALTNATDMFYNCSALQQLTLGDLSALTDGTGMFTTCSALQQLTLDDLPALTYANDMFSTCSALQQLTLGDLPALTSANSMFYYCTALQQLTLGDLPALTDGSSMFSSCIVLQRLTLDLPALTNGIDMFYGCSALQQLTLGDLPALTYGSNMFSFCYALESLTLGDLPALTDGSSMFSFCYALESLTLGDLSALTNGSNMFSCYALQQLTLGDLPALTNGTGMFASCTALQQLTLGDLSALTSASNMFHYCAALAKASLPGLPVNIDLSPCAFSADALAAIFADLKDLGGGPAQTITVTGDWGADDLTDPQKAIATDKNWVLA